MGQNAITDFVRTDFDSFGTKGTKEVGEVAFEGGIWPVPVILRCLWALRKAS